MKTSRLKKDRRLLLIAMSGVRVRDKKLLELGMTLPGFVERSEVIASLPSLSLLTLAAHTPEHWEVIYSEVDDLSTHEVSRIENGNYDLVGISSFTARILDAYSLAEQLRRKGVTVVLGGVHVSVLPEEAEAYADSIVIGEAESIWAKLLLDFERGELKRRYRGESFDFVQSRIPRYELLDFNRYNRIPLQTTRGCPLDCEFCAASRLISSYKLKPIEHIRNEVEKILSVWDKPFIELADDNTFKNKRWSRQLVTLFQGYSIKWFTETDISVADDDELLERLALSGCAQLLIGLEAVDYAALNGIDSRNWKQRQFETYLEKIEKIQSYGLSVNGCFILGLDSDDNTCFERTREFVEASKLSEVQITLLTPFPGTPLYSRLKKEGRLLKEIFWDECTLFDVTYSPKNMSMDELANGFRQLMHDLYADDTVSKRKLHFRNCIKKRKEIMNQHWKAI